MLHLALKFIRNETRHDNLIVNLDRKIDSENTYICKSVAWRHMNQMILKIKFFFHINSLIIHDPKSTLKHLILCKDSRFNQWTHKNQCSCLFNYNSLTTSSTTSKQGIVSSNITPYIWQKTYLRINSMTLYIFIDSNMCLINKSDVFLKLITRIGLN